MSPNEALAYHAVIDRAAESAVEAFKQAAQLDAKRAPVLERLAGRVDVAVRCASYGWLNFQELDA
jgi:hypothetical protein